MRRLGMAVSELMLGPRRNVSNHVDGDSMGMQVYEMAQKAASLEALHPEPSVSLVHRADLPDPDSCGSGSQTPAETPTGESQDRQERPVGAMRFRVLGPAR
jgi:hypothetical protein